MKRTLYEYQLSSFKDTNGYINLKIEKADERNTSVITFSNYQQATLFLFKITEEFRLCQKLNGIHKTTSSCFLYSIKQCNGACIGDESPKVYNKRLLDFIEKNSYKNQSILIIDRGRDIDERSVIFIEDGIYKGYGFYNLNYQINNPEVLKSIITPMPDNRDAQHILQVYLRKNKVLKIVKLKQ